MKNRVLSLKSISPGRGCVDFLVLILNKHGLGAFKMFTGRFSDTNILYLNFPYALIVSSQNRG